MRCTKCGRDMRVTHVYSAGDAGKVQRLACDCGLVATAQTVILSIDPPRGQGAAAVAKRLRAGSSSIESAKRGGT